ncbi:MAG: hypothetical protein E6R04_11860, partial [Spirochaetes bacterium]
MSLNSNQVSVGDTATATQYNNLRKDVLQYGGDSNTTTNSGNTYAVDLDGQFTLAVRSVIKVIVNVTNTGPITLNAEGTGDIAVKKNGNLDLAAGDWKANQAYFLIYDGTYYQLLSSASQVTKFGGNGTDGAVDGTANVTITGSNNTLITKNYSSWAAASGGAKTLTITPTNCILHIKIQGNANFTNWTFNFDGKGGQGRSGGTGCNSSACNPGDATNGEDALDTLIGLVTGGAKGGEQASRGGGGGGG